MKNLHRDLVTLCSLQYSATSYACACLRWGCQARPLPTQPIWSSSRSCVAKRGDDHARGAIIADLWVFFVFFSVRIQERTVETHEISFAFDAEKQHATVHSPSLIQVWDHPSSSKHRCLTMCLCLQQAMVPVFDRKWPCAQHSFGFPVTEGDLDSDHQAITSNQSRVFAP